MLDKANHGLQWLVSLDTYVLILGSGYLLLTSCSRLVSWATALSVFSVRESTPQTPRMG